MSIYQEYPTPPPTSSPKHGSSYRSSSPRLPAQETYYQSSETHPKLPAQQTYFQQAQSYSTPASPTHWDPSCHPPADHPLATTTITYDQLPPRRKSSPIQNTSTYNPNPKPTRPPYLLNRRKSSPRISPNSTPTPFGPQSRTRTKTPPRPIYFSPTNPIPTPYNASRPSPRPGFIQRLLAKISSWIRSFMNWARKNPISAGLVTFLPVLAGALTIRAGKALGLNAAFAGLGKALGHLGGGVLEGMGGGKFGGKIEGKVKGKGGLAKGLEKDIEKEAKEWGWGMDHFVGFGGTKAGPLDGIMKVLLMGVNHYCKLSPSAVPRAASILLDLYFLERKK